MIERDIILLGFRDGVCQASLDPDYVDESAYRKGHEDGMKAFKEYTQTLMTPGAPSGTLDFQIRPVQFLKQ